MILKMVYEFFRGSNELNDTNNLKTKIINDFNFKA